MVPNYIFTHNDSFRIEDRNDLIIGYGLLKGQLH